MKRIEIDPMMLDEYYWGRFLSIKEIAEEIGVGYGTIHRAMKRYNIKRREQCVHKCLRKLEHAEYEKTINLYKQGIPVPIIAQHLSLSVSGVYGRLRRAGVPLRNYHERAKAGGKTRKGKLSPI